jgi:hypothetical protein
MPPAVPETTNPQPWPGIWECVNEWACARGGEERRSKEWSIGGVKNKLEEIISLVPFENRFSLFTPH